MSSIALTITNSDLTKIVDHCRAGLPNEACGILAGRAGRIEQVYLMRNARPGPASYEMEPAEQLRVLKEIRSSGRSLMGIFHSHPGGPAYPSGIDVEQAYWPGTLTPNYPEAVYVIVSFMGPADPVAKAFRISDGTVQEVSLDVTDT